MAKKLKPAEAARVRELAQEMQSNHTLDEEGRKEHYRRKHKKKKLIDAAREMGRVESVKEYVKLLGNFINAEYDVLRLELVPMLMEEQGLENMKVEDLGRVGLAGDMYVSIKAGMQDDFFKWLKKNRMGDLIQNTVNSSTLKAFIARRVNEGKEIPRDLVNVTPYTRASITKA